ncbi:hypothetical protein R84B8_01874 [Treponema sp. R8-4-B8]
MCRKLFIVVLISVIFASGSLFAQEAFTWHLAVVKDNQGVPFDKPVNMNNGEQFSIQLYSDRDFYAYIVVEQADGSMMTLMNSKIYADEIGSTKTLSFAANTHGQEKIYVVASVSEQKSLQRAIDAYNNDGGYRNTIMLQTALSENKGNRPGKKTNFGGSVRGDLPGQEPIQGTEFSGSSTYNKTIIISH